MKYYIFKDDHAENLPIGKIICLARTYKKHADEMNTGITEDPILFLKPTSSIIFNGESIIFPNSSKCLHHEVELGVIIGKKCKKISEEKALNYVLGYVIALDITARDIQINAKKNGWPWCISKGFDTFAPISNVVNKNQVGDPNKIDISLSVNGEIRQKTNTKNMIYSIEKIIRFISNIMTLEKGDLIMTGTPEGVAEIKPGDLLEGTLGNICKLSVDVKCE